METQKTDPTTRINEPNDPPGPPETDAQTGDLSIRVRPTPSQLRDAQDVRGYYPRLLSAVAHAILGKGVAVHPRCIPRLVCAVRQSERIVELPINNKSVARFKRELFCAAVGAIYPEATCSIIRCSDAKAINPDTNLVCSFRVHSQKER